MFELIFEKRALHDLNRFEHNIKERIWKKLQICKIDPFRYFEKLIETNGFKIRIGDWRVIADIDQTNRTITILKVCHRRNIYER